MDVPGDINQTVHMQGLYIARAQLAGPLTNRKG